MSQKELAFEIAYSQLRSQKEDLRNARNQAGMAAAMTGLIGTVFAGLVELEDIVGTGDYTFLSIRVEFWLVIFTFSASLYFAAMVSVAQRTCNFELNPIWIIGRENKMESLEETKALLAKDCDTYFDENEEVIAEARSNLWRAIVLGCLQIPAWLINLV
ncbi:hypothetical protein [Ruegeria arenilitoris]|uniref:hypothetical protein n=1 Tax=Ruegeria arenilitoris TaxID=1173585 RepID=UPI0014809E45|nr:hypothetical protein [Ruegeria arenilitoris]